MALRAAFMSRVQQAVPDFWASPIIFLKAEGSGAKLIAHNKGELGILGFRQVLPGDFTPKSAHDLLITKNYKLKERFVDIQQEGVCDVYEKGTVQFDWNVPTIYVKGEGAVSKLVVHVNGNPRERVVHPEDFNAKSAHETLVSKGFVLKDRFVDIEGEGAVDVYGNDSVKVPPPNVFNWSKTVLVKPDGAVTKLVTKPEDSNPRQVHQDDFTPKTAHQILTEKGYTLKDRFVEDDVEGLCDVYEKLEVATAEPVTSAAAPSSTTKQL